MWIWTNNILINIFKLYVYICFHTINFPCEKTPFCPNVGIGTRSASNICLWEFLFLRLVYKQLDATSFRNIKEQDINEKLTILDLSNTSKREFDTRFGNKNIIHSIKAFVSKRPPWVYCFLSFWLEILIYRWCYSGFFLAYKPSLDGNWLRPL